MPSVREVKEELDRLGIDYSGCVEKSELIAKLEAARPSEFASSTAAASSDVDAAGNAPSDTAQGASLESEEDVDTSLSKINNLLDTLPASLTLLNKKWSESRSEKTRNQLQTVKELLNRTAARCSNERSWQDKLEEYNGLAKDYKKLRDLPRNMNG